MPPGFALHLIKWLCVRPFSQAAVTRRSEACQHSSHSSSHRLLSSYRSLISESLCVSDFPIELHLVYMLELGLLGLLHHVSLILLIAALTHFFQYILRITWHSGYSYKLCNYIPATRRLPFRHMLGSSKYVQKSQSFKGSDDLSNLSFFLSHFTRALLSINTHSFFLSHCRSRSPRSVALLHISLSAPSLAFRVNL